MLLKQAEDLLNRELFPNVTQTNILLTSINTMEQNGITFDGETISEVLLPKMGREHPHPIYAAAGFPLFDSTPSTVLTQGNPQ